MPSIENEVLLNRVTKDYKDAEEIYIEDLKNSLAQFEVTSSVSYLNTFFEKSQQQVFCNSDWKQVDERTDLIGILRYKAKNVTHKISTRILFQSAGRFYLQKNIINQFS